MRLLNDSREFAESASSMTGSDRRCAPDRNGYEFARALRSKPGTAQMRLIAVTAYGSDEDKDRSRQAGFQLHLVKPVTMEGLDAAVEAVANGRIEHEIRSGP